MKNKKDRLKIRFDPNSISVKLAIVIFCLMLGALFYIARENYNNSTAMILNNQQAFMRSIVLQSDNSLNNLHDQLVDLLLSVSDIIKQTEATDRQFEQILLSYIKFNDYAKYLYFIDSSDKIVGVPIVNVRVLGNRAMPIVQDYASQTPGGIWWTPPYKSPLSSWVITIGMNLPSESANGIETLAIDIPLLEYKEVLPKFDAGIKASVLVLQDTKPVYGDHRSSVYDYNLLTNELSDNTRAIVDQVLGESPGTMIEIKADEHTYLVMTGAPNKFGWRTVLISSGEDYENALQSVRENILYLSIGIVIFSLFLAFFVARWFTNPIRELVTEMERVKTGSLQGIRVSNRKDEIGALTLAFDNMMARIRTLVANLEEAEQKKKEAEIRALQYQIRPHFLYNTLNAIGHSAALGRTNDVYKMIQSITMMLSYTLDRVNEKVTLAQELEHINHYLRLQKIRYGDIFQVLYDIQPGLGNCEIVKLTLQPIVENAIFHGLAARSAEGVLKIKAHQEDNQLVIQIIDNGPGIPAQRLKELEDLSPVNGSGSMGLRMVRERLILHCGEQARLTIDSNSGLENGTAGTIISLVIPFQLTHSEIEAH